MPLSAPIAAVILVFGLVFGIAGCSDNRLNAGGYAGETASRLQTAASAGTTSTNAPLYVYRGGRDPVTGEATLRY